ncbi:MFS transporter [Streptomyces sp. SID1046]|uniref:MFS transporter n=1 Tax=Streptomyces sp. SID1046 TaxID=2690249 RepID=UPI001368F625|nr:MFS transporter [Streptomyces sp. SID1046]MYV76111.1 MFS transporter [Streptomyces sp. SID1046]
MKAPSDRRAGRGESLFSGPDRAVITAAALSMLLVQMDWFALNLTLPVIARDYGEPTTDLQWLVSGYMLTLGAFMITGGRVADVHGRRRTLVCGLVGFGAVSVFCGLAPSTAWLVAGRVVQGVTAAFIFPVAVAVVTGYFRDDRQGRAVGTVLAFSAVGTALGPFVGGTLAEHVSWRAVFFLNVPICAAAAVLMLRHVPETRDTHASGRLDLPGAATLAGGLTLIMLGVDQGAAWGWTSPATWGCLVAGAALLTLLVRIERHSVEPLLDLGLLRNGPFVTITLAGSLSNVVYCLVAVFSALYLQQARGLSPFTAGLVFLALSVGAGTASYFSGHLARRWRPEVLMAGAMLLSGTSVLVLTWSTPLALYVVVFAVVGTGLGLGWALTNVATQSYVPPTRLAAASGFVLTSLVLLGALAVAVASTVLEALSGSAPRAASDGAAIETVLRAAAVLALLGGGLLLRLVRVPADRRRGTSR